jgi:hypothetical protein
MKTKLDALDTMTGDLLDYLDSLPPTSPYRWPIFVALARRVPATTVADMTGMNTRTVRNTEQRLTEDDDFTIECGRHPGEQRVHVGDEGLAAVRSLG